MRIGRDRVLDDVSRDAEADSDIATTLADAQARVLDAVQSALGLSDDVAGARARILYWAFVGFALSDKQLAPAKQQAVLDELLDIATR